jgi:hypothetical protein
MSRIRSADVTNTSYVFFGLDDLFSPHRIFV